MRLTDREKGNIKYHKPCKLNNKTVQRDSHCVSSHLPQPTSHAPSVFYLLLPVPYSSPAARLRPSPSTPPHLYEQLSSPGDWVQTGSIPFGRVAVVSHQAPAICVSVSPSVPLWAVYNIQPLLQLFQLARSLCVCVCVGWCAGSYISIRRVLEAPDSLALCCFQHKVRSSKL